MHSTDIKYWDSMDHSRTNLAIYFPQLPIIASSLNPTVVLTSGKDKIKPLTEQFMQKNPLQTSQRWILLILTCHVPHSLQFSNIPILSYSSQTLPSKEKYKTFIPFPQVSKHSNADNPTAGEHRDCHTNHVICLCLEFLFILISKYIHSTVLHSEFLHCLFLASPFLKS